MKVSDWLDEKEAANVDVSQMTLPTNMAYDEDPDETLFYKEINPAGFSVQKTIPLLRSNNLDTGTFLEV